MNIAKYVTKCIISAIVCVVGSMLIDAMFFGFDDFSTVSEILGGKTTAVIVGLLALVLSLLSLVPESGGELVIAVIIETIVLLIIIGILSFICSIFPALLQGLGFAIIIGVVMLMGCSIIFII